MTTRNPVEAYVLVCESGHVHIGEAIEAFLDLEHARDEKEIVDDNYGEECGKHRIAKLREVLPNE